MGYHNFINDTKYDNWKSKVTTYDCELRTTFYFRKLNIVALKLIFQLYVVADPGRKKHVTIN